MKSTKEKLWLKSMKIAKILWGCHQRGDRSFFIKGYQFPLCARCMGIFIGYLAAIVLICFHFILPMLVCLALMVPLVVDGSIQLLLFINSNNIRRLITGILFGIGFAVFVFAVFKKICMKI